MPKIARNVVVAFTIAGTASAQVLTQPGAGGNSSPPPSRQSGGGQPQGGTLGGELPFLDPGSEVVTWDGKMWNITDNRVFSARFEKYLASPAADDEEDQAYRDVIEEILKRISPSNPGGANMPAGVALLPEAAQFPIDAKLCDTLANSIWGVWLSQKNVHSLNATNAAMKTRIRELGWNYEVGSEGAATRRGSTAAGSAGGQGQGAGAGGQGQTTGQTALELSRLTLYVKDATEMELKIKANELEIGVSAIRMKLEFQALLVQFFLQRRFEHVIMGCRFYRNLFQDGDATLQINEGSDANKMFASGLGFSPTIGTLDTLSSEAIRDVDESVRAFDLLAARGDLESASKRLSEAFLVGEYLPRIRRLAMEEKLRVLDFVRDSNQLISSLEVRNYGLAEEVLERMKNAANDFDYSKAEGAIQSAKTVATMYLAAAKTAAQQGDKETVYAEMRKATEIWPNNPALAELAGLIADNSDVRVEAVSQLDRLITERAHRNIFAEKEKFGAAVATDPERLEQLKEIVNSVAKIDSVIALSEEQASRGDSFGAWEMVKRASEEYPEDTALQRRIQILTESVTELVGVLSKAHTLEDDGEFGSSLARYLEAKEIYPGSMFAKEGIERVLEDIRPKVYDSGPASTGTTGGPFDYRPEPAAPAATLPPPTAPTAPTAPEAGALGSGFAS